MQVEGATYHPASRGPHAAPQSPLVRTLSDLRLPWERRSKLARRAGRLTTEGVVVYPIPSLSPSSRVCPSWPPSPSAHPVVAGETAWVFCWRFRVVLRQPCSCPSGLRGLTAVPAHLRVIETCFHTHALQHERQRRLGPVEISANPEKAGTTRLAVTTASPRTVHRQPVGRTSQNNTAAGVEVSWTPTSSCEYPDPPCMGVYNPDEVQKSPRKFQGPATFLENI